MRIYKRTGDAGMTSLSGGARVPKTHACIEAYGTIDELNSYLGLVRVLSPELKIETLDDLITKVQTDLMIVGADLATPPDSRVDVPRIEKRHILQLETYIDTFDQNLPELRSFVLPGGSQVGATLHIARTVCRRAERLTIRAGESESINENVIVYLNRLSDLLFVLARWINDRTGHEEDVWNAGMG